MKELFIDYLISS
jgi:hypothetical protein